MCGGEDVFLYTIMNMIQFFKYFLQTSNFFHIFFHFFFKLKSSFRFSWFFLLCFFHFFFNLFCAKRMRMKIYIFFSYKQFFLCIWVWSSEEDFRKSRWKLFWPHRNGSQYYHYCSRNLQVENFSLIFQTHPLNFKFTFKIFLWFLMFVAEFWSI
jgi:hypothetical protein